MLSLHFIAGSLNLQSKEASVQVEEATIRLENKNSRHLRKAKEEEKDIKLCERDSVQTSQFTKTLMSMDAPYFCLYLRGEKKKRNLF